MRKIKIGVVSDFIGGTTGFSNVVRGIFTPLREKYQITNYAINYDGSFHEDQKHYRLYVAADYAKGDPYGINKIGYWLRRETPDIIFVLQDTFIADRYAVKIREIAPNIPLIGYFPVDSVPLDRHNVNLLNLYDMVIAYTEFGRQELIKRGLHKECRVVPHGVYTDEIYPIKQEDARRVLGLDDKDRFIVLNVAMNQPRKRVDLFLYIVSEWLKKYPNENGHMYYHGPIIRQGGINVPKVIEYLAEQHTEIDFASRFITTTDNPLETVSRETMKYIYSCADVYLAVSAQEGWNLPLHEALASKVASIAPCHSATAEWPNDDRGPGLLYAKVDPKPNFYTSGNNFAFQDINVPDAVEALQTLYRSQHLREQVAKRGYEVATNIKYTWPVISQQFDNIFTQLLGKE